MEYSERITAEAKCAALSLEVAALQWNPRKGFLAAIAQVRSPMLCSGLSVLLAYSINGSRVQPEQLATSDRQTVEVKPTEPSLAPSDCVLLAIVAKIPYVVHRAALLVQKAGKGLHAVGVNYYHWISIQ
jgi:hypothetical protein